MGGKKYTGSLDGSGNKLYGEPIGIWSKADPDVSSSGWDTAYYYPQFSWNIAEGNPLDGEYLLTLTATDFAGNIYTYSNTYYVDTTAPAAPTAPAATGAAGSITLTWTASTSADVTNYQIFMADTEAGLSNGEPTRTVGVVPLGLLKQSQRDTFFRLRLLPGQGI